MRADAREVEAFLRTARLDPDDDTPRLILADYLEENGEADRAEFIRVQCQLAAWVPEARERMALQRRERELLAGHRDEWLGPFAGWGQGHTRFRRGMIEAIVLGNPLPGRISPWVSRLRYRDADLSIAHWFSVAHEIDFGSGLTMVEAVNDAHEAGVKRIVVGWPEPGDAFDELPDHPAWPFPRLSRLVLEGATAMRILLTPPGPTWMAEYMPPEPGQTPPTFLNSIGMRLNLIPAGSYIRGTAEAQDGSPLGDEPPREVRITRPFYAGAYQVTRAQYYRRRRRAQHDRGGAGRRPPPGRVRLLGERPARSARRSRIRRMRRRRGGVIGCRPRPNGNTFAAPAHRPVTTGAINIRSISPTPATNCPRPRRSAVTPRTTGGCTTRTATSASGAPTGTPAIITARPRSKTRRGRIRASLRCCEADRSTWPTPTM